MSGKENYNRKYGNTSREWKETITILAKVLDGPCQHNPLQSLQGQSYCTVRIP